MIVMKFGGTSVGSAESMILVADAISKQEGQKLVVLSASSGITDKLINITNALPENTDSAQKYYKEIEEKTLEIATGLQLAEYSQKIVKSLLVQLQRLLEGVGLLNHISQNVANRIIAMGELLSTTIFSEFYFNISKSKFVDITDYLVFNLKGESYRLNNKPKLKELLEVNDTLITQGFICRDESGNISNLGRGGSDYSAAIIAAEMQANELQIWTDVNGIMSADPRIISKPVTKEYINLENLSRMAFFGAKVIHPDTLKPSMEQQIPVRILNTFNAVNSGTLVTVGSDNPIPTMTIKKACFKYSFAQNKKKSLYLVNKYITNTIIKNGLNLLSSNQVEHTIEYVFTKNIDKLIGDDLQYSVKEVDLIYICELNNSKINSILTKLNNLNKERLEINWQDGTILILASADNSTESYDILHDTLINMAE